MRKKIFLGLALIVVAFCVINCKSIRYGLTQAKGQYKIIKESRPIQDFVDDPAYPDSLKSKLLIVQAIKKYCKDSLGLVSGDNYTEMFDQKGKPGMWVVTASDPFELKSYQWSFSFLGDFSYKGYFEKEKALALQKELKAQGYDTDVAEVNAWSTLGWFTDPVMSSMLKKSEARLARVLIHEITHYNIFVKNDISYNENLAMFIGDMGALKYLQDKYGENAQEVQELNDYLHDIGLFTSYLVAKSAELNQFYKDSLGTDSIANVQLKKAKIKSIVIELSEQNFRGKHLLKKIQEQADKVNNCFFTDFLTYKEKSAEMEIDFKTKCNSDVKQYIDAQKEKHGI